MRRLRYAFLLLVTLSFAAGIVASLISNQRSAELTASRIQLSAWSLAQLEQEYLKFHTSLRLFQAGIIEAERLQLDYDLLWNRLGVFLAGEENRIIRERFSAESLAQRLFSQLQEDEDLLFAANLQPGAQLESLIATYGSYQQPIRRLIIRNFTGPEAARIIDELHEQRFLTQGLLLGLLFCGGALLLMLFLESRRNNFLAHNDTLTQMPNRQSFLALTGRGSSEISYSAMAVIEMNNFRSVNEYISHEAGDRLLSRIGNALNRLKPEGSFIARVGGDEFIMTFSERFPCELVVETLKALAKTLSFDFQSGKQRFQVNARIGVVFNSENSQSIEKLYFCATLAARELRLSHSSGLKVFDEEINNRYLRSRQLLSDLRRAINGTFPGLALHYQPILGLKEDVMGVEVLLRWNHPSLGYLPPQEVVELAENNQLGLPLGRWLLQQLKQDLHKLPEEMRQQLYFSLNVSPTQFTPRLPQSLAKWLKDAPIAPEQLLLEMTESISVVNFDECQNILQKINALGIDIALDDFGTGYSSLSYLSSLKVQRIKIDKSFIQGISRDLQLQRVVRSIIELCHGFNFRVICEGIEDSDDDQQIRLLGSDYAQGYYYGKPMALAGLLAWFSEHRIPVPAQSNILPSPHTRH
jgi:diguanylate cyclase (GGDEF)-like protein